MVKVGEYEAYRTIESYATPAEAERETQQIVGGVLGELFAGAEWRRVRDTTKSAPTRRDLGLAVLRRGRGRSSLSPRGLIASAPHRRRPQGTTATGHAA